MDGRMDGRADGWIECKRTKIGLDGGVGGRKEEGIKEIERGIAAIR